MSHVEYKVDNAGLQNTADTLRLRVGEDIGSTERRQSIKIVKAQVRAMTLGQSAYHINLASRVTGEERGS